MHHQNPYGANAYRAIGIETGVAAADPLGLVVMLYDGAIQAVLRAETHLADGNIEARGLFTSKAIDIVRQGLEASLDKQIGGPLAESLAQLYDYMARRLVTANLKADVAVYGEVRGLLAELRQSWTALRTTGHSPYPVPSTIPNPQPAPVRAVRPETLKAFGRSVAA